MKMVIMYKIAMHSRAKEKKKKIYRYIYIRCSLQLCLHLLHFISRRTDKTQRKTIKRKLFYFCLPYSRKQYSSALHNLSSTKQIHVI